MLRNLNPIRAYDIRSTQLCYLLHGKLKMSSIPTTIVNIKKKPLNARGIKDFATWAQHPNCLYIGRNMSFYVPGTEASKWKNIFEAKKYGLDQCLVLYEAHVRNTPELWNDLESLKGKELGCWCKPNKCHGDVLIQLLAEKEKGAPAQEVKPKMKIPLKSCPLEPQTAKIPLKLKSVTK